MGNATLIEARFREGHPACKARVRPADGTQDMGQIRALIVEDSSMTIATEGSRCHVIYALSATARGSLRKPFAAEQLTDHVSPILEKEP